MSRFRTMRDWLSRFRKVREHKNRANLEAFIRSLRPETPSLPLIRCGGSADGGYLLPDDFSGVAACVSPGVAGECGFDLDMAGRGLEVYMTDASVDGPPVANPKFHFSKLFLDTYNSETTIRIDDFCQNICDGRDLVLQMDIEGAEYRVFNSMSDALLGRFRIIVLEAHNLDALFTPFGFSEMSSIFSRLLRTHSIVHIHPNNAGRIVSFGSIQIPKVLEFTFLRRDRAEFSKSPTRHPHPLDKDNVSTRDSVILPELWHY